MTIQRADTFASRTVASGFGTASDGNVWTINAGDGQSVGSNEGKISGSSASTFATLGASLATADAEVVTRVMIDDSSNTSGLLARWTDTNNYYLCRYDGVGNMALFKDVAGTKTTIVSAAFTPNAGTFYWLKFHVSGTTLEARWWQDGTSEPSTWGLSTTDSALSGSGGSANKVGLYGFVNFGTDDYDSFSADDLQSAAVTLAGASAGVATASATLSIGHGFAGESDGVSTASTTLIVSHALTGASAGVSSASAVLRAGNPGTGIGDITRTTGTQTANKSGTGYGVGDISGTEHDYAYTASDGSGWAIGANPWYGGMPASAWYQLDPTLNTTLPQRTSLTGNLMSLLTTQSGGIVHWEEDSSGGFQASELPTFANAGNFIELAPTNTPFRAYVKAIGDAADANGISWTAWMCVYPGDPGFVVFRFDQHNGTGAAISVDESDIELIASLLTDTGANPTGAWNAANGFIGTIGGSVTNGWPAESVHQAGTFDYLGITPDVSSGLTLGTGAAVIADPSVAFGWSNGGYEAHITAASGNPGRIKIGFYSDVTSAWNIPAGQTNTFYVLRVFRRNLTSGDMAAMAADFKFPGTPTTTAGTFTSFSVDERAYVFAASGAGASSALSATLDLSPAHVTARYKPILKVTGWTGGEPALMWGGSPLVNGVDYRHYHDTSTNTLYVQLYYDVVASGAGVGQRNNAALSVSPAWVGTSAGASTASAALTVSHSLAGASNGVATASASLSVSHALAGESDGVSTASATLQAGHGLSGESDGVATASAALTISHPLSGESDGASTASVTLDVGTPTVALAGMSAGQATAVALLTISHLLAGVSAGVATASASLSVGIIIPPPPDGVAVALATAGPSGVGVALTAVGPVGVGVSEE